MEIKGKVHCFFEQSGTFKNEFIKLGIPAEDYDIQNNFGQTDHVADLFKAIEDAYDGKPSLFDDITADDLIIAFFPCIYFCDVNEPLFRLDDLNYRKLTLRQRYDKIIERAQNREYFFELCIKMFCVCDCRGLRLIMENPYSQSHYLCKNFVYKPKIIDKNRRIRGDYFVKPTQYWFLHCEPTYGLTQTTPKETKTVCGIKGSKQAGLCGEERSMISPDYARNFICDCIIGKAQKYTQLDLFENYGTTNFNDKRKKKYILGREHRIHVSPRPIYFWGTLLGWEVDIISYNESVESKTNVCGRLKTEEEAIRAGIEYVEELLKSL